MMTPRSIAIARSWKSREQYTNGVAGTKFHNSWRAIRFTAKGKKIGVCEDWQTFKNFTRDMLPTYSDGLRLFRLDKTKGFSKDNCVWLEKELLSAHKMSMLAYNGQEKTLYEWAAEYNLNYNGLRQRYFRGKNYTPEMILFGKIKGAPKPLMNARDVSVKALRLKASKMISSYRCRDKKRGVTSTYALTIEWFIENILLKACVYCSSEKNIGADRLDNTLGHNIDNIVPCCYRCNTVKNTHFTYEQMLKVGDFLKNNIDR